MSKLAMPKAEAEGLGLIILLLWILVFLIRHLWRKKQWRYRERVLTRRTLVWMAIGWKLTALLFALVMFSFVFFMLWDAGVMGFGSVCISICIVGLIFAAVFAGPDFRTLRSLAVVLNKDMDPEAYKDRVLIRIGGIWKCVDEKWFIRLGWGQCALLYAPMIDFANSAQIRMRKQSGRAELVKSELVFIDRIGRNICALCDFDDELKAWIAEHQ